MNDRMTGTTPEADDGAVFLARSRGVGTDPPWLDSPLFVRPVARAGSCSGVPPAVTVGLTATPGIPALPATRPPSPLPAGPRATAPCEEMAPGQLWPRLRDTRLPPAAVPLPAHPPARSE